MHKILTVALLLQHRRYSTLWQGSLSIVEFYAQANGFYGSKGVSGRIPEGYTLYEQRFMRAVRRAGKLWKGSTPLEGHGVLLNEWEKPEWTYHAKGRSLSRLWPGHLLTSLFI